MNIMIIGKYPPIVGGESSKVYWLAQGLAKIGHKVFIISNCQEVEIEYRISLEADELHKLQNDNIKLFSTNPLENPKFIPKYNPFSEKITSLALDVANEYNIDIIIGWYMLPYWIAAYNVSKILNIKFVLQHAGSDIKRLLFNQDLNSFLVHIIKTSDAIMSYVSTQSIFETFGAKKIFVHKPQFPEIYNSNTRKIDLSLFGINNNQNNTFLFLGKISKQKGIFYLLEAFNRISDYANLLIIGSGNEQNDLVEVIKEKKIKNVYIHSQIAPWKVPSLLASVKTIVVPEYNFNVKQHKSRIPIEAVLCGKIPLVSNQIINNYNELKSHMISLDVENINNFSNMLENYIDEEFYSKKIDSLIIKGSQSEIRSLYTNYNMYINSIEKFLEDICNIKE